MIIFPFAKRGYSNTSFRIIDALQWLDVIIIKIKIVMTMKLGKPNVLSFMAATNPIKKQRI